MALIPFLAGLAMTAGLVDAQNTIHVDMRDNNVTYSWPGTPPTSAYNYNDGHGYYIQSDCGGAGAEHMGNYQDTVMIHFRGSNPVINFLGTNDGGTANVYLDGNFIHQANIYAPYASTSSCTILPFPFYADPGDHVVSVTVFPNDGDTMVIRDFWYTSLPPAPPTEEVSTGSHQHTKVVIGVAVGAGVGVLLCLLGLIYFYRRYRRRQTDHAYRNAQHTQGESSGPLRDTPMATVERQSRTSLAYGSEYGAGGLPVVATSSTNLYATGNQRSSTAINRPLPSPPPPGAAPAQQPFTQWADHSDGLSYSQLQQSGMFSPAQLEIIKGLLSSNAPRSSVGNIIGMMLGESQAGSSSSQRRTASPDASSISRATKPTVSTSSSPDLPQSVRRTDPGGFSGVGREELPPSYEGRRL